MDSEIMCLIGGERRRVVGGNVVETVGRDKNSLEEKASGEGEREAMNRSSTDFQQESVERRSLGTLQLGG